jgi:conjugative relaxase-like TrwC/TraI family protein
MLSIWKLAPGRGAYYERSVAAGIDDYYAGKGESPGVWIGTAAIELELGGVVGDGELGRLLSGRHPITAAVVRRHPPKRQITLERIDPASGERRLEQKTLAPVAGYDLVFSTPKSVSLLHALGGPDVRHAVGQAHLAAWQTALAYLESEACVTRRGRNGVARDYGSGFVSAAYQHRTSRAQDPHLHTHVIVANMARSPDGVWRALDGQTLLKTYRRAAGYLYEAQLRFELTQTLGLKWRDPKEMAEIAGIPQEVLRAFSQRRAQVLDYLELHGTSGFYAARVATIRTRDRKQAIDLPRLVEEWRRRADELGFGRSELERLLNRNAYRELDERGFREVATRLLGPEGLTEKRTSFSDAETVIAWAEAHNDGAPVEHVLRFARRFIAMDQVVPLGSAAPPGRPTVFSTSELLRQERATLALVERGVEAGAPTVSAATVERVARERAATLGREQVTMLHAVTSSLDRVACVVGRAGSGKTTGLVAVAEAFKREGFPVIGAAPSGVAAELLANETGIPTGTLHRLVAEAGRRGGLPRRCVLLVDEAGMADTRTLARTLRCVERSGGKAVLIGDPAQLPAVGAGGLFAAIVDRYGAVELTENRRQNSVLERRALAALRAGHSRSYLTHAAKLGRLVVTDDHIEAKARLVADWWQSARADPRGSIMVAYRRCDVVDLNAVARALMDGDAQLGRERLPLQSGLELAAGDRVVCSRNHRGLQVTNGTRGTVAAIDPAERAITFDTDDGRRLSLPSTYLDGGHIGYAYALTGHKTQGLTVKRAFVLTVGEGSLKEWGYVALSRAWDETRLYTTTDELEPDTPPAYRPEPADPVDRLAKALTRPAAETLAVDVLATLSGSPSRSDRTQLALEARALATQRRALEKQRTDAARKLHRTKQELDGMGLIRRARRGPGRDQIIEQRTALARLDIEVDRLDRELQAFRERARRAAFPPGHARRRKTLARAHNLERGLGPE